MTTQANISQFEDNLSGTLTTTIAESATTSSVLDLTEGGLVLCGIFIPSSFTGTSLTFLASPSGADDTFVEVYSTTSGTALSYDITENTYCAIDPKDFAGIQYLQIVSGSTEGAARTLICALKGI